MRLKLLLPVVNPRKFSQPRKCRQAGCAGVRFIPRQEVSKKIVDAQHQEVRAWRYQCVPCGSTFRVYPEGVTSKQISQRVNGMAVMLYLLGLSYGSVELMLESLGLAIGKGSTLCKCIQTRQGQETRGRLSYAQPVYGSLEPLASANLLPYLEGRA